MGRLVRFEELATDPERVLASLMEWFDLSFEPAQLVAAPSPTFRRWEDRWKRDAEGTVDARKREVWRSAEEKLSPEELGRMAPWLVRFGYPEPARVSSPPALPSVTTLAARAPEKTRAGQSAVPLLLIGAQRAATTSVAHWLATDPAVAPIPKKEPIPLAARWPLDRADYLESLAAGETAEPGISRVLCDPAPYYLLHPDLPRRARQVASDARIVAILRDPVTRAYSHWLTEWKLGAELLPFGEALAAERSRLAGAEERLAAEETAVSFAHVHYSYQLRGRYASQLARWYAHFPADQILVLVFEELLADPVAAWKRLRRHLDFEQGERPELPHLKALRWPVRPEKLLRTQEAHDLRASLRERHAEPRGAAPAPSALAPHD